MADPHGPVDRRAAVHQHERQSRTQDYFADGIAEEIITALSRSSSLFVIARNSSFIYEEPPVDVRRVGRELGVGYVLEGSVRRGGDRLRITGQLVDAARAPISGPIVSRARGCDVFELQDRVAASIVAAIEPTLQQAEIERHRPRPAGRV